MAFPSASLWLFSTFQLLIKTSAIGFIIYCNTGWFCLKIFTLITSTKAFIPYKLTFWGSRWTYLLGVTIQPTMGSKSCVEAIAGQHYFHIDLILWGGRRVIQKGSWERKDKCDSSGGKQVASRSAIEMGTYGSWVSENWYSLENLCVSPGWQVWGDPVWWFRSSWLVSCKNTGLRLLDLQLLKRKRKSHFKWYLMFKCCQLIQKK